MNPRNQKILHRLSELYPQAQTELRYHNAFQLLIAVVMSAQTTDRAVNRVTERLFEQVKTPEDILAMGEEALGEAIRSIGLWRSKARHIFHLSQCLVDKHASQVPNDYEALHALAGVGRKTAAVVMSVLFDVPYVAVDTHVFRVANRTGLAEGATVEAVDRIFHRDYPSHLRHGLHHRLILHGRYVCKARVPLCKACGLQDLCRSASI